MGLFNPFKFITYFIKKFINIFIHKFFYIILAIFIIVFVLLCNFFTSKAFENEISNTLQIEEVKKSNINLKSTTNDSPYHINRYWFTQNDYNKARQIVGDEIWYNSNYDIFLSYKVGWNNWSGMETVVYFDTSNLSNDTYYVYTPATSTTNNNNQYSPWYVGNFTCLGSSNNSAVINGIALYNNQTEGGFRSGDNIYICNMCATSSNQYYPVFASVRNRFPIYDNNNKLIAKSSVLPYIDNSTTDIENWSFDNFIIKGSIDILDENSTARHTLQLRLIVNDYTYTQFVTYDQLTFDNDIIENGQNWTITIPKNLLFNDLFNSESNLLNRNFVLSDLDTATDYDLGTFDIILTQQQLNDINGQNDFNQQQQLQQDITNPNISSDFNNSDGGGFRDFSDGMEIQDNTSIDSMFNMIYNAFTTQYGWNGSGQVPYELEITLPISNQTIKISPYTAYGRNWYTDNDNTAISIIKNLISMFWWFIIGRFVIKDIRNTINKVAEGNIEEASSDIKKEIL